MSTATQERTVLEGVSADLRSQGYDVFVEPAQQILPMFLKGMSPDAIAVREDKKLVLEITHEGVSSRQRLEALRKKVSSQNEWELVVIPITGPDPAKNIDVVSKQSIEKNVADVETLLNSGQLTAGLLLAWATLEALGRLLLPSNLARPQTPGRLVEVLATHGYVTPDDADNLRQIAKMRNGVVHGGLDLSLEPAQLGKLVLVLKLLVHQV